MCTLPGLQDIKNKKLLFLLFLTLFAAEASAQFAGGAFWKKRGASLRFTTTAQTVYAKNCSGIVTVKTYNSAGAVANVGSTTTVSLSGSSTITFYSDSTCTTQIASATIASGTSSTSFYFLETAAGSPVITVAATGYQQAGQTETVNSNPYIWTGGGANANWSTAANWSGNAVPGSSNIALFDGSCSSNCSPILTANTAVGGIRINSDYTGTITQNAGVTLTVSGSNYVQYAGTFIGGTANVSIVNTSFRLLGGTFTSTTATLYLQGPTYVDFNSGATFNHNNGSFTTNFWNVTSTWNLSASPVFNNLSFDNGCSVNVNITGSMTANGTVNFHSGCSIGLNGGTLYAKGNINTSEYGGTGTMVLNISGSSSQTITGQNTFQPNLPDTVIASTGGTVTFVNRVYLPNFTYVSGTLDMSSSTLHFPDRSRLMTFTPGNSNVYNNITWDGNCASGFALNGTLNMSGTLNLPGGCSAKINGGGTINLSGNLTVSNKGASGDIKIYLMGTGNQTVTGGSDVNVQLPYLEIASTGGTVTFSNSMAFTSGFKYTSGTVDTSGSTIYFYDHYAYQNTVDPGSMEFTNVYWYGDCNYHLALTGTMIVKGLLTMGGGCPTAVSGGKILASGNANLSWASGTVELEFTGPASTTLSQGSTSPSGNITVSKTGGATLTLSSNASFNYTGQGFDLVSGGVDLGGKNLTVKGLTLNGNTLTKNTGVLTVNGTVVGTGPLYGGTVDP